MDGLQKWTVEVPDLEPVTVYAETAGAALTEAAELHHLPDVPHGSRARDERGQEFACSSATS